MTAPDAGGRHRPVTVVRMAAWEAETFPVLRRICDRGRVTLFDDVLPDDVLADLDETRAALAFLDVVGRFSDPR